MAWRRRIPMVSDVTGGGTGQTGCRAGLRATLTSVRNSPQLPLALLLPALFTVFLFGNERGHFYRSGHHNNMTANYLALAANLSPDHNFLGFYWQTLDADGAPTYEVYNRFPIGGSLLIKLAIIPFDDNLSAQLYAARLLMLLFFTATAVLAYLSLARLTAHRWIALTATLLTFSSTYCLYYHDAVATASWPDLFGVWLVFHGMVLFVQEDHFRQLLVKTCLALLLGWSVYALLLPFVVLGLAGALVKAVRDGVSWGVSSLWGTLPRVTVSLLRSRYVALGVVALLFGTAVLSVNFANEYVALNGETGLTELPSVRSMLMRTGQIEDPRWATQYLAWPAVLKSQFYRIGGMSLPWSLSGDAFGDDGQGFRDRAAHYNVFGLLGVIGVVASGTCLIGLTFVRHTILWATLVLYGFCWGLPMRHFTAFHEFQSLFYIGLPLVFFSFVLLAIHRLSGRRLSVVVGLSVNALLVFVLSSFQMASVGYTAEDAEIQSEKNVMSDLEIIRKMTAGKVVATTENVAFDLVMRYALTGTTLLFEPETSRFADFVISRCRYHDVALLTPENRRVFLYHKNDYDGAIENQILKEEPLIHAESRQHLFDVYLSDNCLSYVRSPRSDVVAPVVAPGTAQDERPPEHAKFFLHVTPVDTRDLPDHRKQWNFDNLDFSFKAYRIPFGKRAIAVRELPAYDIVRIHTGQFTKEDNHWKYFWDGEIKLR